MNYKYKLLTFAMICFVSLSSLAKINEKKFSSVSTICRVLDVEKDKAHKDKIKLFKEKYYDTKDIVIEKWNDGNTYYVLYDTEGKIALMDFNTEKLISECTSPVFYDNMEYIEWENHKYFRINDNKWMFHNGISVFNPNTDFKEFGGEKYIITGKKPFRIYNADGIILLETDRYEFREAKSHGFTHDTKTGLSIYHPDVPHRFIGHSDNPDNYAHGKYTYELGYYTSPDYGFRLEVPGGEYFVNSDRELYNSVNTEVREDIHGKLHEYKVFETGNKEPVNSVRLCYHSGRTGTPVVPHKAYKIKISTPDQIVYYHYKDYDNNMSRMGCISLIDSTFKVSPKFNDVKVFYDSENKPYALVKLSALSPYELYDPNKKYDYSDMTELQLQFEKRNWSNVISKTKPSKLENLLPENIYPWLYAEIELLKETIDSYNEYIIRLSNGNLFPHEEQDIVDKANGTYPTWYNPINFGPTIEEAVTAHISKLKADDAEKYKLMLDYLKMLTKQKYALENKRDKLEAGYIADKRRRQQQQDAISRQMVVEAEMARKSETNRQQTIMVGMLRAMFGIDNKGGVSSPSRQSVVSSVPNPAYTPSMLEQTNVSPEIVGAAITSGWIPETSTSTSKSSESSNVSSGNLCHACFGSKKCGVCHGKGRYMPNLDGKFIDCTACKTSGVCQQCNGKGFH